MRMKSKIKSLFSPELRHDIAAICDTKRIEKNTDKMNLLARLLKFNNVKFDLLGGATNRMVIMMDGYAIKIAVDRQGYKDNWMEYALCEETQPYTTKSYETNGYLLVQNCIRLITVEEWRARKGEIIKILDAFGQDYLLGDVGYYDLNMANWGVDDDGTLKICDYAYCHRLTEQLFTCPVCGSVLTYDMNFNHVLRTDRANCHEKYSYNDIKSIQGEGIDWEMIGEKKKSSVMIPDGLDSLEVNRDSDMFVDDRTIIIRSYRDLNKYETEVFGMEEGARIDMSHPDVKYCLRQGNEALLRGDRELADKYYNEVRLPEKEKRTILIDPEFAEKMERDKHYHAGRLRVETCQTPQEEDLPEEEEYGDDGSTINLLDELFGKETVDRWFSQSVDDSPDEEETLDATENDATDMSRGDALDAESVSEDEAENIDDSTEDEPEDSSPYYDEVTGFTTEPVNLPDGEEEYADHTILYLTGDIPNVTIMFDNVNLTETYTEIFSSKDTKEVIESYDG